jgi:PilZ domain-containing protein
MVLTLEVAMRFQDAEHVIDGRTANISREGLFIYMDPPKPIGTMVRVRVQVVDSQESFTLEGVVVRAVPDPDEPMERATNAPSPPGIGVFLTSTSAGWGRFVDSLGPRDRDVEPPVVERVRDGRGEPKR